MGEAARQYTGEDWKIPQEPHLELVYSAPEIPAETSEDQELHYNQKASIIQEKLATLSSEERMRFTPAIIKLAEYRTQDLPKALSYADSVIRVFNEIKSQEIPNSQTESFSQDSTPLPERQEQEANIQADLQERIKTIQEKFALLSPEERKSLAPTINQLTLYKNDPQRGLDFADTILALNILEPGQTALVRIPSEIPGKTLDNYSAEEINKLVEYTEKTKTIQNKLNKLSQTGRTKFIPALQRLAKYHESDIQAASEYADVILEMFKDIRVAKGGQNAISPRETIQDEAQMLSDEPSFDELLKTEGFDKAGELKPQYERDPRTEAVMKKLREESSGPSPEFLKQRREQKAQENKEWEYKIKEAKQRVEEAEWQEKIQAAQVRTPLPDLRPTEETQIPKKLVFSQNSNLFLEENKKIYFKKHCSFQRQCFVLYTNLKYAIITKTFIFLIWEILN